MPVKLEMTLSEQLADDDYVPDVQQCEHWANLASMEEQNTIASLQVVSAQEMQQLNLQYREKNSATNVLSFPMQLPDEVGINLLGDIAVCASVITDEAKQQAKSLDAHWAHMIVHGMLHLQGYDHVEDEQAGEMEALEIKILKQLGYANPYNQ